MQSIVVTATSMILDILTREQIDWLQKKLTINWILLLENKVLLERINNIYYMSECWKQINN